MPQFLFLMQCFFLCVFKCDLSVQNCSDTFQGHCIFRWVKYFLLSCLMTALLVKTHLKLFFFFIKHLFVMATWPITIIIITTFIQRKEAFVNTVLQLSALLGQSILFCPHQLLLCSRTVSIITVLVSRQRIVNYMKQERYYKFHQRV